MKQIFYSEKLNKNFDTEQECIDAEKAFDDAKAAKAEHENSFDDDDSADYENMSDDSWGE